MPVPEVQTPLNRFQRWFELSKPNEFDKPTIQELVLVGVSVLLAPILLAFAYVWVHFQPEFLSLRPGKRVLFALVIPFLLLPAYCYVVVGDFLWPLVKRVWLRARMMRRAERAVQQLLNSLE